MSLAWLATGVFGVSVGLIAQDGPLFALGLFSLLMALMTALRRDHRASRDASEALKRQLDTLANPVDKRFGGNP